MKLIKISSRIAMSLVPIDIVFYKDEDNKLYRLLKVPITAYDEFDALEIAACKNRYAPDIINGEIVEDGPKEIHIRVDRIDSDNYNYCTGIYKFQKNAENYEFWDITDDFKNTENSDKRDKFTIRKGSDFL